MSVLAAAAPSVSLLKAVDLLARSTEGVLLVGISISRPGTGREVEPVAVKYDGANGIGWNGMPEEIVGSFEEDCYCDRACCQGYAERVVWFGWGDVLEVRVGEEVLYSAW